MISAVLIGAGAGLVGGIVGAAMLSVLAVKGYAGEIARAILLLSHTAESDRFVVGWLVEIAAAVALGVLFGVLYALFGSRRETAGFWGPVYGLACWIVGWFAVVPPPLRFAPWAAIKDPTLFQLAVAGLLTCLSLGAALGVAFSVFGGGRAPKLREPARAGRAVATGNRVSKSPRRTAPCTTRRRARYATGPPAARALCRASSSRVAWATRQLLDAAFKVIPPSNGSGLRAEP